MAYTSGRSANAPRYSGRDRRDERNEVGFPPVHIAPFAHVSRFVRHGLWPLAHLFSILCGQSFPASQ